MLNIHPLIQQLSKLRESSKEAVADANIVLDDELKNYLHIKRPVESELSALIEKGNQSTQALLILVCGNVGDGKSHLLSKLRKSKKLGEVLKAFKVFNDATESFSPSQTSNDSLRKILAPFAEGEITKGSDKVILAINLGTLSNFLAAHGEEFSSLRAFVTNKGIIDSDINKLSVDDQDTHFNFVNFTNRHFFNLGAEGALVEPLLDLLSKIVSDDPANPIYKSYLTTKAEHWAPFDPVMQNYELLLKPAFRKVLAQLIVSCIIKEKQILSFRQLLNFVYDIIVPFPLAQIEQAAYGFTVNKMDVIKRLSYSLPYYLFENPNLSKTFHNLALEDPAVRRYEGMDERIILMFTEIEPLEWIKSNYPDIFPLQSGYEPEVKLDYNVISKAYLRYEFFSHPENKRYQDDYFQEFLQYLYAFNNEDSKGLRGVVELVKSATYYWNGGTLEKKKIIVPTVVKNSSYRIFKDLTIRGNLPTVDAFMGRELITEFRQELLLSFSTGDFESPPINIAIDYALFVLLKNVANGYRPNKIDRYTYIGFDRFVEQLTFSSIEKKALFVDQINFGQPLDYQFEFDEEYQEFTFTKITKS